MRCSAGSGVNVLRRVLRSPLAQGMALALVLALAGLISFAAAAAARQVSRPRGLLASGSAGTTGAWSTAFAPLGLNDFVDALLVHDNSLFAGGEFTAIGPVVAARVARYDGQNWSAVGQGMNGAVYALGEYRGDLIAGGAFSRADEQPAQNVARWTGSSWDSLGTGLNGTVGSLAALGDDLVAAGTFQASNAKGTRVACWNGVSWRALGRNLPDASGYSLAVYHDSLYVGCSCVGTDSLGNHAGFVLRWNGSAWSPVGSAPEGFGFSINGFSVDEDHLYVFGDETGNIGVTGGLFMVLDGDHWRDLGYGDGCGDPYYNEYESVEAALEWQGHLVVSGCFAGPERCNSRSICLWPGTPMPGGGTEEGGDLWPLAVFQGDLYAAGAFSVPQGVSMPDLKRSDGSAWTSVTGAGQGITGEVDALAYLGPDLIAAGSFLEAGDQAVNGVARWDGSAWHAMGAGFSEKIAHLVPFNGGLVAVGDSTSDESALAFWDGQSWQPIGHGLERGWIGDVTVYHGELIAGGWFSRSGNDPIGVIARWDGAAWRSMDDGVEGAVRCFGTYQGHLLAGGEFHGRLAVWNGSSWQPFAGGAESPVIAIQEYGGNVFIIRQNGQSSVLEWWDGTAWHSCDLNGSSGMVRSFAVYGGHLIAAAKTGAPSLDLSSLFVWDGSTFVPFEAETEQTVLALAVRGSELAAGGTFQLAGETPSSAIAVWTDPAVPAAPLSFRVTGRDGGATIHWDTAPGWDSIGWRLHAQDPGAEPVTLTLTPRQGSSSYVYDDAYPGVRNRQYWLEQIRPDGLDCAWYGPVTAQASLADAGASVVQGLAVWPNPGVGSTTIAFRVASPSRVRLTVVDATGRTVRVLADGRSKADSGRTDWDGKDANGRRVPSGAYWIRFDSGSEVRSARVILVN